MYTLVYFLDEEGNKLHTVYFEEKPEQLFGFAPKVGDIWQFQSVSDGENMFRTFVFINIDEEEDDECGKLPAFWIKRRPAL